MDARFSLFELVRNYVVRKFEGGDVNIIGLNKKGEDYIVLYDDNHRDECLRTLGRYASNDDLSFTWYDAAVLSQKIRQETEKRLVKDRLVSKKFNLDLGLDD